jgi:signal transduction histidine kinase
VAATLKVAIRSAIAARLSAEAISADLAAALTAATEARQAKTRFIAAATHDLRQPLQAAALFFNRIAARQSATSDATVVNARLAFAEAAGLLDQLLEHLRLDGGMIQPNAARTPLATIIPRVCTEVAEIAAVSAFRIDHVESRLAVTADPALLVRILRNLLHNAMRHSRGSRILVGARQRGGRVRIYVVDNGRGIPLAHAASLFDDLKPATSDPVGQKGVGLGLPSSRRMAELMGGSMGLDPVWRHGAAFYCELPLAAAEMP